MRHFSIKSFILLQLCLYLLGGHATAHGLAWCISAEGHAHVATAAGCVTEANDPSCTSSGSCVSLGNETERTSDSGTECRHLPVTSPHATGVASAPKVGTASVVAIIPASYISELYAAGEDSFPQSFPKETDLPRPIALTALRTIVLLI